MLFTIRQVSIKIEANSRNHTQTHLTVSLDVFVGSEYSMSFVSSVRGTAAGCDQVQFGAIFAAMAEGTGTPTHRPLRPLTLSETEGEEEGVPDGVWWIWNPKKFEFLIAKNCCL